MPGALTWNELGTPEVDGAVRFYGDLFGWSSEPMPTGDGPRYVIIKVGECTNGGIREQTPEEQAMAPPYWLPYIAVESTDKTVELAGTLGASTILPPMDVPGRQRPDRDDPGPAGGVYRVLPGRARRLSGAGNA